MKTVARGSNEASTRWKSSGQQSPDTILEVQWQPTEHLFQVKDLLPSAPMKKGVVQSEKTGYLMVLNREQVVGIDSGLCSRCMPAASFGRLGVSPGKTRHFKVEILSPEASLEALKVIAFTTRSCRSMGSPPWVSSEYHLSYPEGALDVIGDSVIEPTGATSPFPFSGTRFSL